MGTEPGFQVRGPDRGSGLDLAEALARLRDGQGPYRADGSRRRLPRRTEQPYATGSAIVVEHDAARLDPAVWGTETSMAAEAASLRTAPVQREENGMRVFSWSTTTPALHARYRLEWRFRA